MNNKKLFKGALVLFASILMAVSCSAGDKTGNNDNNSNNNNNNNTEQKKDFGAFTTEPADAATKPTKADGTGGINLKIESKSATASTTDKVTLAIKEDSKGLSGVTYTITDVNRVESVAAGTTISGTQVDLHTKIKKESFTFSGTELALVDSINVQELATANKDYDVYKVTIQVSKDGYNSKSVDVYVVLTAKA